ncbi:hypothetical protein GGR53DRAFT_465809 [Hypoxylon sp. FL1150]|nr:hypothetical protein GGR53DRAFT_465809 [Hypoxylon sp. FL1150]
MSSQVTTPRMTRSRTRALAAAARDNSTRKAQPTERIVPKPSSPKRALKTKPTTHATRKSRQSEPEAAEPHHGPGVLITYLPGPFGRLYSILDLQNNTYIFHHERDADRNISMTFIREKIVMLRDHTTGEIIYPKGL